MNRFPGHVQRDVEMSSMFLTQDSKNLIIKPVPVEVLSLQVKFLIGFDLQQYLLSENLKIFEIFVINVVQQIIIEYCLTHLHHGLN